MNLSIFSFIFAMWVLIIIGGGLMVLFIGPLSFSGYGELNPLINSGVKVLIAMILIFIWVFALLKIKNWIFRKIANL
uniref:Uncharacterized protein n=1 Tax=uncultured marine thaumarchaeote KM3_46_G10 TaxID=1456161 RepID=A0A075H801_9ARCH|nr:hypothetical protein [uncultured marine thaumarchaeote KM3_46_G10]